MELLAVGRVGSAFGVKGLMKISSYSGESDHLLRLKEVALVSGSRERRLQVEEARIVGGAVVMKFEGVDSPEAGRGYAGWEIWVPRSAASGLEAGEYYHADLCACSVVKDGATLGRIRSVCDGGAADLLEVETPDGKLHFVPFLERFVGEVRLDARTVELKADWLLQ